MRGIICGFATFLGIYFFVSINIYSYIALIFYAINGQYYDGLSRDNGRNMGR